MAMITACALVVWTEYANQAQDVLVGNSSAAPPADVAAHCCNDLSV